MVTLTPELSAAGNRVVDEHGRAVPSQRLSSGELVFLARGVPPFAAKRFRVEAGPSWTHSAVKAEGRTLVHPDFRLRVDEQTGAIASWLSRRLGKELVEAKAATALNDYFYLLGANAKDAKRNDPPRISIKERGPLVASLRIESDAPSCRRLAREVRVVDGLDRVELLNLVGKGLNQTGLVKTLIEKGPDAIKRLKDYGAPILEKGMGYIMDRPEGSPQLPGILLIKPLVERLKTSSIKVLPGLIIFDLIVEEGEVCGALGFLRNGNPCLIRSRAVVLATGGAGAMYRRNDNQRSILGDGYALALRAGLPLFDLEFVQFYPFALGEPRLSSFLLYPPYPREVRLFDEKKEDLLERFGLRGDLNRAIIVQRDRLSIDLYQAAQNGDVFFDLTQVPPEKWEYYPLNFLKKSKFPFLERPFLISPAVHFFMGGVEIDEAGRTSLPGLYAAGEVAWGIHGANRLGGNALTECAVELHAHRPPRVDFPAAAHGHDHRRS